jgi:hypothetical protein
MLCQSREQRFVIPAQAGIQLWRLWIPACAGMTIGYGMTLELGMTIGPRSGFATAEVCCD